MEHVKCRAEQCPSRESCLLWLKPEAPGQVVINPDPWLRGCDKCASYAPAAPPPEKFCRGGGLGGSRPGAMLLHCRGTAAKLRSICRFALARRAAWKFFLVSLG